MEIHEKVLALDASKKLTDGYFTLENIRADKVRCYYLISDTVKPDPQNEKNTIGGRAKIVIEIEIESGVVELLNPAVEKNEEGEDYDSIGITNIEPGTNYISLLYQKDNSYVKLPTINDEVPTINLNFRIPASQTKKLGSGKVDPNKVGPGFPKAYTGG